MKPLLTINKWSGMSETGGLFLSNGFKPDNIGGNPVIGEYFRPVNVANVNTTNFSGFTSSPCSLISYDSLTSPTDTGGTFNPIFLTTDGKFFLDDVRAYYSGILHTVTGVTASQNADIIQLESNNFLYSTANGWGKGYFGFVKTGSGTTKIIDTAGRNWVTLGVVVGESAHNKVTNLRTGAEYTITSITTTTEDNDTLNFTASGSLTNAANNQFIVWIDDAIVLGASNPTGSYRNIQQFGDAYFMSFNNHLAYLASDETTSDNDYKQLPANSTALFTSVNGDKILVASVKAGRGQLLYWDGFSDGWNNILEIDNTAYTLTPYKNGWLYMVNNTLFFTDGWNIQKISDYPDKETAGPRFSITPTHNGLTVYNDTVFAANNTLNYNRVIFGCVAFDFNYGWYGLPSFSYGKTTRCGFSNGKTVFTVRNNTYDEIFLGCDGNLLYYSSRAEFSSAYMSRSFIQLINLEEPKQIKEVELNICRNLKEILNSNHLGQTATITVNVGDAHKAILSRAQVKATSTTTSILPYGNTYKFAEVGNELLFIRGGSLGEASVTEGERSYITAISGAGTADEAWTISPALSGAPTESNNIIIINVKKSETKTVSISDLNKPVRFSVDGFYSNKIFVEVVITGGTNSFPVSIFDMKLYGE